MTRLALELNDAGILAVSDNKEGTLFAASPGVAVFEGDDVLTGVEAMERARLKPRWTYNRFWDELDTAPLPRPFPTRLSRADLAHAHLKKLWQAIPMEVDEALLAVPGWSSDDALSLMLGIAHSCDIPVVALIDSAVAATADKTLGEYSKLVHLDLHLHRTCATELVRTQEIRRERVEVTDEVGRITLHETWVKLIAEIFVRQTRFDPLHAAATEQLLYLRLPQWLHELRKEDSTAAALHTEKKEHMVELTREQIVQAAEPFYQAVLRLVKGMQSPTGTTIVMSERLAALPGLEEMLEAIPGTDVHVLLKAAAARGALHHAKAIRTLNPQGQELTFITRLPLDETASSLQPPSASESERTDLPVPTHVLLNGIAHALGAEPFHLGLSIPEGSEGLNLDGPTAGISRSHCSLRRRNGQVILEDHSSYGCYLNGERVHGKALLCAGDKLRLGSPGVELQLITVVQTDG